jgi:hypothetical protein
MSGETEDNVSGWTVDTLHQHEAAQHNALRLYVDERFVSMDQRHMALRATLAERTAAYIEQHEAMRRVLDDRFERHDTEHGDLKALLNERYATQVKALDAAFLAQQTAMQVAFTAADKAVVAALDSAKEAVAKAETANEKRFDSVNEFRAQLADQANTFIPRTEAVTRINSEADKLDALAARLDKLDGRSIGAGMVGALLFSAVAAIGTIIVIVNVVTSR